MSDLCFELVHAERRGLLRHQTVKKFEAYARIFV